MNDPVKGFGNNNATLINGKSLNKNKYREFVWETLDEQSVLCEHQVKITDVPAIFSIMEKVRKGNRYFGINQGTVSFKQF